MGNVVAAYFGMRFRRDHRVPNRSRNTSSVNVNLHEHLLELRVGDAKPSGLKYSEALG